MTEIFAAVTPMFCLHEPLGTLTMAYWTTGG